MRILSLQSNCVQINKYRLKSFIDGCFWVSSLFIILFVNPDLQAQSTVNTGVDFKVVDEKLSSALYRLANKTELNFTYDAGDSLFKTKISYQAVNKAPLIILDELLSNTTHTFKQIGNQVVIYKQKTNTSLKEIGNANVSSTLVTPVVMPSDKVIKENNKIQIVKDTVFIVDTLFRVQSDTIRVFDTVYVERDKKLSDTPTQSNNLPLEYFNSKAARNQGWTGAINFAPVISNFSLAHQENTLSIRNFSLGIEASKNFDKINVSAGLKLTHFAEKFNHNYSVSEGGFFITDTIDEYYTISQLDTTWYYVTDSSWSPVDNHEYNYNINNRVGYLEFFAALSYDFYTTRKFELYAKAGFQSGFLIYNTGRAIPNADEPMGVDFADLKFTSITYSVLVGSGINYRLSDRLDFNSELYYFNSFNSVVVDYPKDLKLRGGGVKVGVVYYF
jgi:hypothetical protein